MKILISKNQYKKIIVEQKYTIPPATSDYTGKGGGFERKFYNGDKENYVEILKKMPAEKIKQVRLIFPKMNWEQKALEYIKKLGIVTGIYTSVRSAIDFVSSLVTKGVKTDELVVGSHGTEGKFLFTKEGDEYIFVDDFLQSIKKLTHPRTKVFFTACDSADYLDTLKNAAEKLGIGVYGSAGIYNYVLNSSEKGFYYCSPSKFKTAETTEKINPIYDANYGWVALYLYYNPEGYKCKIKIKDSVFGIKIPELESKREKEPYQDETIRFYISKVREPISLYMYYFNFFDVIKDYAKSIEKNGINFFDKKERDLWTYEKSSIRKYLDKKLKSKEIIIEINGIDIFNMKPYIIPENIDNEFLLKNKLCQKVSNSPISWIDI